VGVTLPQRDWTDARLLEGAHRRARKPRETDEARPRAEHRRVGDEAAILAPHMELVAGRFEHEPQRRFGGEVKAELVRVLGAVPATVLAKRRSIARCRWPHRMRSTWG
jgi:hypothetical protein